MTYGLNIKAVCTYVKAHPGCSRADAAKAVSNVDRGYAAINRALTAGLIVDRSEDAQAVGGRWRPAELYVVEWRMSFVDWSVSET